MTDNQIQHRVVYRETGKFAGWPANGGSWAWGDELLVGLTLADHKEGSIGHAYKAETSRQMFARSIDGGETWTLEDGFSQGITASAKNHNHPSATVEPGACPGNISFAHPEFGLLFMRSSDAAGPAHFYLTDDRGRHWHGPYALPMFGNPGILARTDYIIEDEYTLLAMLTVSKRNGKEGRVGCARTRDKGRTWEWVSWLGDEPEGFTIMPATVQTENHLCCIVRRHEALRTWLAGYRSNDRGATWQMQTEDLIGDTGRNGNPPALVRLTDGRLCLAYGIRSRNPDNPSRICVRFSADGGDTWSAERVLRGDDGANWDMGYPRIMQRPDGALIVVYYYNHAWIESPSYCYIAATIFRP